MLIPEPTKNQAPTTVSNELKSSMPDFHLCSLKTTRLPEKVDISLSVPRLVTYLLRNRAFVLSLNMYTKKSPGPDGIPNAFLKRDSEYRLVPNHSFPVIYKKWFRTINLETAKIIFNHKGGSASSAENYRRISLTSTCSKLLEHVVSKHLLTFINDRDIYGISTNTDSVNVSPQQPNSLKRCMSFSQQ